MKDWNAWQRDAHEAFAFVDDLYQQAGAMFADVRRYYEDSGCEAMAYGKHGGIAIGLDIAPKNWPYAYFKVVVAILPGSQQTSTEFSTVAFVGVDFTRNVERILGPYFVFGVAQIASGAKLDHWAVLSAIGNNYASFDIVGEFPRRSTANADGRKRYPGVQEVAFFELPLGLVQDAHTLQLVVKATLSLASGDTAPGEQLSRKRSVDD